MEKGDQKVTFMYDYQGRRVRKQVYSGTAGAWSLDTETHFFYDGWNLIHERVHTGTQTTENAYLWGIDLSGSLQGAGGVGGLLAITQNANSSPQTAFPSYDGNGNVTKLIAASDGSIQNSYTFDPFGNIIDSQSTETIPNPFTFSTKYHDLESGFHYYGYRYYNPQTGRWLNRDPIGEWGGPNLYTIVFNDSINFSDNLGKFANPSSRTHPPLPPPPDDDSDDGSDVHVLPGDCPFYRLNDRFYKPPGLGDKCCKDEAEIKDMEFTSNRNPNPVSLFLTAWPLKVSIKIDVKNSKELKWYLITCRRSGPNTNGSEAGVVLKPNVRRYNLGSGGYSLIKVSARWLSCINKKWTLETEDINGPSY